MFFKGKLNKNIFLKFKGGLPNSAFRSRKTTTGFSLVELIVVMGIFTIMTSIVIFNYGRFSSNLIVTNLAYESALAVRQAQVYGISVKKTSGDGGNFDSAYGVWFEKPAVAPNQNFYLFADKGSAPDKKRNTDTSEDEEAFSMNGSNLIKSFCVTPAVGGTATCSGGLGLQSLSIIFKRPDPNAKIYGFAVSGGSDVLNGSKAEIMFTSGRGDKIARMTVTNTGQISVNSCPIDADAPNQCPE